MHLEVENHVHLVAYVKCKGTCDQIQTQYQYDGIHDCLSAAIVPGSGDKSVVLVVLGMEVVLKLVLLMLFILLMVLLK